MEVRSNLQKADQIAFLGTRGHRRSKRSKALKSTTCRSHRSLEIDSRRSKRWRALESTEFRSHHTPWNSRVRAFQAMEDAQIHNLAMRSRFWELRSEDVPSGRRNSNPQPIHWIAIDGTRRRRRSKRWRALKSAAYRSDGESWNSGAQAFASVGRSSPQHVD